MSKELAIEFLVYGALAELFARENGFHKGLGGSMHAFFLPFGVYAEQCSGRRFRNHCHRRFPVQEMQRQRGRSGSEPGANGSMGRGPVWEALSFATMDQYRTLWETEEREDSR